MENKGPTDDSFWDILTLNCFVDNYQDYTSLFLFLPSLPFISSSSINFYFSISSSSLSPSPLSPSSHALSLSSSSSFFLQFWLFLNKIQGQWSSILFSYKIFPAQSQNPNTKRHLLTLQLLHNSIHSVPRIIPLEPPQILWERCSSNFHFKEVQTASMACQNPLTRCVVRIQTCVPLPFPIICSSCQLQCCDVQSLST